MGKLAPKLSDFWLIKESFNSLAGTLSFVVTFIFRKDCEIFGVYVLNLVKLAILELPKRHFKVHRGVLELLGHVENSRGLERHTLDVIQPSKCSIQPCLS